MHANPGSPKRACWAMAGDPPGSHQWIKWSRKPGARVIEMCWICGARRMKAGENYGEASN